MCSTVLTQCPSTMDAHQSPTERLALLVSPYNHPLSLVPIYSLSIALPHITALILAVQGNHSSTLHGDCARHDAILRTCRSRRVSPRIDTVSARRDGGEYVTPKWRMR